MKKAFKRTGRYIRPEGYILIYAPYHPLANSCGTIYEHRLIAAEKWGIDVVIGMHVHHKNGDRSDNKIENLEILSPSEHSKLHHPNFIAYDRGKKEIESVNLDDYLFVDDAAEIIGVKEGVIRNYLSLGKLTTYKFKHRTFLSRVEIEAWRNKPK